MTNEQLDLLKKFTKTWGNDAQLMCCLEEMSELSKEICKYFRYKDYVHDKNSKEKFEAAKKNIIEETADVLIMATQLKLIFGAEAVEAVIAEKITRTATRLNQE